MEKQSFFSSFPSVELGRMITNIDRFDVDAPKEEKFKAEKAIEIAEELTNNIVEENL